jgi:hypothetical protein
MKKSTIAASVTAIAIAMIVPFGVAQTPLESGTAPPTASTRNTQAGPGMMGGQVQGQGDYVPGAMGAYAQTQGSYGPGMMGAQGQAQGQTQGAYGPGMMRGYGAGWMGGGGYGGFLLPLLLVLAVAGLVAWVVAQKKK